MFSFNKEKLDQIAQEHKEKYQSAHPVPHIYFDNFLPEDIAQKLLDEFPKKESSVWGQGYNDGKQVKLACEDTTKFPAHIKQVLEQCNSSVFIDFLEELTGIKGLIPDPHFRGGGMHQIDRGGFLKVHVDFNWHKRLKLERRLNVLLYLSKDWKEEYGGHFELWDKEMKNAEVKVVPSFNRLAMFSTSEDSYHGHPDPLACPEHMSRKSLALYYYTSPADDSQARSKAHSTLFFKRPGEEFKERRVGKIRLFVYKILKKLRIK